MDSGLSLDASVEDNEYEESGENREGEASAGASDAGANDESISLHDLTVCPDDRLTQWNMGNSSGKSALL